MWGARPRSMVPVSMCMCIVLYLLGACGPVTSGSGPQADAGTNARVLVGEELPLDASESVDGASYRWAFGDGEMETATEPNTVHTWRAPGHYTVVLVVEDVHKRISIFT